MTGQSNNLTSSPRLSRAPQELGTGRAPVSPRPAALPRPAFDGDTDLYLRRSYDALDKLRRAVAERTGSR